MSKAKRASKAKAKAKLLTTAAASRLITEITGLSCGPGTVRYYESIGRLRCEDKTTTGMRLFREAEVRYFADRLTAVRTLRSMGMRVKR